MSERKKRIYMRLNLVSLFFTAVSFISVTLAWFAYSGLVTTQTEVGVKAWQIEFDNNGNTVSNNVVISLDDIYPGMDIMSETINIKNKGDSDAMINYKVKELRILDEVIDVSDITLLEDELAHKYPFHINMNLTNSYANAHDGSGKFSVSVSWPLDSNDDKADTEWGNKAYEFQSEEAKKYKADSTYVVRSAIEIVISLEAVQYIGEGTAPDPDFPLGSIVLYDPVNNLKCTELAGTCLKTYVIDVNNNYSDGSVTLLPVLESTMEPVTYDNYDTAYSTLTQNWIVTHNKLSNKELLPVIATDIVSSVIVGENISNQLIGNVNYTGRVESTITKAVGFNGYFRFKNEKFSYLNTTDCYWLADEYNTDKQFAIVKIDEGFSKIYGEDKVYSSDKNNACKVAPVITVSKANFEE